MTPEMIDMIQKILTGPALASAAAAIISLAGTYFPGLNVWFAEKGSEYKQLTMLVAVTLICLMIGAIAWTGLAPVIPSGAEGALVLFMAWLGALQTNQSVYKLSPEPKAVTKSKASR